ncbi:MAG: sortase [Streptococcaceae bacterium]|jgi:hypothetical protein|nr:sortase [Streptococcaceae bacterium]
MTGRKKVLFISVLAVLLASVVFIVLTTNKESRRLATIDPSEAKIEQGEQTLLKPGEIPVTSTRYKSQYIQVKGRTIHYANAGVKNAQKTINKKPNTEAATWSGVRVNSVTDKKHTHFIAHNPGAFSALLKVKKGDKITVVDNKKRKKTYKVTLVTKCDDYAYEIKTKRDLWNTIVSTGGGERITLQTCLSKTVNLLIEAK